MIVVDTHVLVWWVATTGDLSPSAHRAIERTLADEDDEVIVSSISAWEIAMLVQRRRLVISMDVEGWLDEVSQIDGVRFLPVNNDITVKATQLPGTFHKDPADRIIVATARALGAPLITADDQILQYEHVKSVW